MPQIRYGSLGSHPARFTDFEAWTFIRKPKWCEINASEILFGGEEMSRAEFEKTWSTLPPLPEHAFTR